MDNLTELVATLHTLDEGTNAYALHWNAIGERVFAIASASVRRQATGSPRRIVDELTNDTVERVLKSLRRQPHANPKALTLRAAKHVVFNHWERKRTERDNKEELQQQWGAASWAPRSPDEIVTSAMNIRIVQQALAKLKKEHPELHAVVYARDILDQNYTDIARSEPDFATEQNRAAERVRGKARRGRALLRGFVLEIRP